MKRTSFNFFIRHVYPGATLLLFFYWRYYKQIEDGNVLIKLTPGILCLLVGMTLYNIYRALFLHLVLKLESLLGLYPQFEFHRSIVDELNAPKSAMKIHVIEGCKNSVLSTLMKEDEKEELWLLNGAVHSLLLTSLVSIIALCNDIVILSLGNPWYLVWSGCALFFFITGIVFDGVIANQREIIILNRYKEQYKSILQGLLSQSN